MNTRSVKLVAIPVFLIGFIFSGNVPADDITDDHTLHYDNRAYVHAIHNSPNPAHDVKVESAKIVYTDKAYGQAIYSYPANVTFQEIDFNIELVNTANGQAIYSYPNNNPVQPHLELNAGNQKPSENSIVPVVWMIKNTPSAPVIP